MSHGVPSKVMVKRMARRLGERLGETACMTLCAHRIQCHTLCGFTGEAREKDNAIVIIIAISPEQKA